MQINRLKIYVSADFVNITISLVALQGLFFPAYKIYSSYKKAAIDVV